MQDLSTFQGTYIPDRFSFKEQRACTIFFIGKFHMQVSHKLTLHFKEVPCDLKLIDKEHAPFCWLQDKPTKESIPETMLSVHIHREHPILDNLKSVR